MPNPPNPPATVIPTTALPVDSGAAKARSTLNFVTLAELDRVCQEQPSRYIVDGLLPADDVHVAVGDSGLGKTPWAYQLALCVATGTPFLGHSVTKGKVLYYDLENGRQEILDVNRSLCRYLGIRDLPADFLVLLDEGDSPPLEDAAKQHNPSLIIIDTLRAFQSNAEGKNGDMAKFIQAWKKIARTYHCAILLLHHVKKPSENGVPSLESTPTLQWLLQASGARALVNQTNARIAFDAPNGFGRAADAALILKVFVKMRGESGPFSLARVLDAQGEPIGYRRIVGCELLGNDEQEGAFYKLAGQLREKNTRRFTFKDARLAYGRTDNPTRQWLKKLEAAGMVLQVSRGEYEMAGDACEVAEGSR